MLLNEKNFGYVHIGKRTVAVIGKSLLYKKTECPGKFTVYPLSMNVRNIIYFFAKVKYLTLNLGAYS